MQAGESFAPATPEAIAMPQDTSPEPSAEPSLLLPTAVCPPMGLLYTLLRHGHGLSIEEALRRSWEPAAPQPGQVA